MTDARMAALEAVVQKARVWRDWEAKQLSSERYDMWDELDDALAALDALPAPAQEQGATVECWEHESGSINFLRAGSSDAATLAKTKYWRRRGTVTLPIRVEGGGE